MVTKLDRVVDYDEGHSTMISHDTLNTWSREVTWQIKSLKSPILQNLQPLNLTRR